VVLEGRICSSLYLPQLTREINLYPNMANVLPRDDAQVHIHSLQTTAEHFQSYEWALMVLYSWKSGSLFGNNSWIMGCI
jgi:hypothetical protein